ncbi:hypothetical protein [Nevskia soli]|uniref:hypothetical protein n=1 Tax=Nevskia soli TaxID=418856 RepID=UPI001B80499E|nr:hypothetical protein [Nevskia soli]
MNAQSDRITQSSPGPASRPRLVLLAVLAVIPALGAVSGAAQAQAQGTDQPIVASLNPPPAGLACDAAAAATSVYFQFANPPFQISQISLYLDGKGVPQDAVDEHWPTVTLTKGLHPGSNTVDIVANGASGQHIERRMLVQVGGVADGAAAGTAQVACDDNAVAQQIPGVYPGEVAAVDPDQPIVDDSEPPPVVVQDAPPVIYETQPQVVYEYPPPVYVYTPYPVVAFGPWVPFVPFFGFGFFYHNYHPYFSPPRVVVNNYYYGHGGWNGGGWHGGPGPGNGWHGGNGGNNGGWHGNPGGNNGGDWHGGGNNGGHYPGSPQAPNNGGAWHGAPQPVRPPMNAGNNGGWHGQAPGVPQNHGGWQGGGQHFAPRPAQPQSRPAYNSAPVQRFQPAQQFRQAPQQNFRPSAPAFHGGGNPGGGGHGGGHGGPGHR